MQADINHQKRLGCRIPIESVRVTQAVRVNFSARALNIQEWILVRPGRGDAVTAIGTEHVFGTQIDVRSDPQNLPEQIVELLRKSVRGARRFSLSAVSH